MVVAEVPKLAFAAEYFFKMGWKERDFDPRKYLSETVDLLSAQVLLLMATALNVHIPGPPDDAVVDALSAELRLRQQRIAEITEMIHLAILVGDFLLSRACVALASLKNTEVVSLLATVVKHLVTGETIQMTTASEQRCSKEYHLQKTYYKTASLISNSCKAIALLAGQTAEVSTLAYEYGKNLGLAFQLIDDVLDFTGTSTSLGKGSLSDIHHIVTEASTFSESPAGVDDRKCLPAVKLVLGQIMNETLVREFMNMYKEITMIGSHHRSQGRNHVMARGVM
ncbi:hypothetical protein RHMOL_Rhmol07G0279400 [Rhododendron molle]|uniref:Uncharacterized protein n=1 Tax=Rhododendron molle TaxID=49168 RepID=A0ACC0N5B3_RHOML|nr:hypothetical protein RHMOL_Rhmol07G0279400 [Rhododendron molle]